MVDQKYKILSSYSEGLAVAQMDDKFGYVDENGDVVIPFKYSLAHVFSEGLAAVKKSKKWGFIDKSGKTMIASKYNYASGFSEGLCFVKKTDAVGFIDKSGEIVISCDCDFAENFHEGLAMITKGENSAYIDRTGKEVIPFGYGEYVDVDFDSNEFQSAEEVEKCFDAKVKFLILKAQYFVSNEKFNNNIESYIKEFRGQIEKLIDQKINALSSFAQNKQNKQLEEARDEAFKHIYQLIDFSQGVGV